jgi:hypothetical protein
VTDYEGTRDIARYTVHNSHGAEMTVTNFGCTLLSFKLHGRELTLNYADPRITAAEHARLNQVRSLAVMLRWTNWWWGATVGRCLQSGGGTWLELRVRTYIAICVKLTCVARLAFASRSSLPAHLCAHARLPASCLRCLPTLLWTLFCHCRMRASARRAMGPCLGGLPTASARENSS